MIFTAFAVFISLVIFLMVRFTPQPPVGEMEYARECLAGAGKSQANIYSGRLYREAKICYDSAMANWQKENERFIFFRDYRKVLMFANLSAEKAAQAGENSISSTTSLKAKVEQKIDTLNNLVYSINRIFVAYPLETETRSRISKGKMLLKEAETIYNKGHYLVANRKLIDSEYLLTTSYESVSANMRDYFKSYPVWKTWTDKTIRDSKKKADYSIIIDKFSRKLTVYQKGIKRYQFDTELGKNWVGDKRVKGDNATPEGMYRITKKLEKHRTKYYKALLIDYPNKEDIAKFKSEIAEGSLPSNARIGGLIEIHGNGGKGVDWTEGCIALTDKEMDVVFRIAKVGTPVTIVGSTADLPHLLNK